MSTYTKELKNTDDSMTGILSGSRDGDKKCTPDAIYYRNKPHTAQKLHQGTTHRVCPPEETYERILPILPKAGITRMADVTGLDRIGIPTILAMRPNAPTLSNSSGKGFTTVAARVSAAMEGIELFCAEEEWRFPFSPIVASYNDLASDGVNLPDIELLPLSLHSLFSRSSQERWALGWDIFGQCEVAVPFETVTMVPVLGDTYPTFSFQIGSNGLASGNVLLEAICSGLYEVIERDAVTNSNILAGHDVTNMDRLRLATIPYDNVQELVERLQFKGIIPFLLDCTIDTQVPTYEAYILDRDVPSTGIFKGYGSHLDPEVAMLRALTEAVQSRAVYIAGSRDDMMNFEHRRLKIARRMQELFHDDTDEVEFSRDSQAADTFEEDCLTLLDALANIGIERAVVFDLSWPEFEVSVVRVVVPGLEGYGSFPYYRPGPRGRAAARMAVSRQNNSRFTKGGSVDS